MNEQTNKATENGMLAGLSADGLKGRQSVRATFKLPASVIELLSVAANQLGLKQKSLFDQLVENREILEQVAAHASTFLPLQEDRQQKTYVISRNSLMALDHVARTHRVPRDLLVEISIGRLLPVLDAEQEKQKYRREMGSELAALLEQSERLQARAGRMLGADDQSVRQLERIVGHLRTCLAQLAAQVELGKTIENYR